MASPTLSSPSSSPSPSSPLHSPTHPKIPPLPLMQLHLSPPPSPSSSDSSSSVTYISSPPSFDKLQSTFGLTAKMNTLLRNTPSASSSPSVGNSPLSAGDLLNLLDDPLQKVTQCIALLQRELREDSPPHSPSSPASPSLPPPSPIDSSSPSPSSPSSSLILSSLKEIHSSLFSTRSSILSQLQLSLSSNPSLGLSTSPSSVSSRGYALRNLRSSILHDEILHSLSSRKNDTNNEEENEVLDWIQTEYSNSSELLTSSLPSNSLSSTLPLPLSLPPRLRSSFFRSNNSKSTEVGNKYLKERSFTLKKAANAVRFINRMRSFATQTSEMNGKLIIERTLLDGVQTELSKVEEWNQFDIFALYQHAGDRVLSVTLFHLFNRLDLFSTFNIPHKSFHNFITAIETKYQDVPYHNNLHAADVTANMFYFITRPSLSSSLLSIDFMAALISAAVHDVGHFGTTNQYHVSTRSEHAINYNDRSILENYHCAQSFAIMSKADHNLLEGLSSSEYMEVRQIIIEAVLATDMSQHFRHLSTLKAESQQRKVDNQPFSPQQYKDRTLLISAGLHMSDLSNPCKPFPIYSLWKDKIIEEFYLQGDMEREAGLTISPMMDRTKPNVERSQIGFFSLIVEPLLNVWADIVGECKGDLTDHLTKNRKFWEEKLAKNGGNTARQSHLLQTPAIASARVSGIAVVGNGKEEKSSEKEKDKDVKSDK